MTQIKQFFELNCLEICGVNTVIYKCYIICNLNLLYSLIVSSNSWVYTVRYPGGILCMLRCHDGILLQEIIHICFDEMLLQNALLFVFKSVELSIIIVLLCRQTLFKITINVFVWWNPFTIIVLLCRQILFKITINDILGFSIFTWDQ